MLSGQTSAPLGHTLSSSHLSDQGSWCLELSHHIHGDRWTQAPALLSVLALQLLRQQPPAKVLVTTNLRSALTY